MGVLLWRTIFVVIRRPRREQLPGNRLPCVPLGPPHFPNLYSLADLFFEPIFCLYFFRAGENNFMSNLILTRRHGRWKEEKEEKEKEEEKKEKTPGTRPREPTRPGTNTSMFTPPPLPVPFKKTLGKRNYEHARFVFRHCIFYFSHARETLQKTFST